MRTQDEAIDSVETNLETDDRLAEMFIAYNPNSINKAIADAKEVYSQQYDIRKKNILARKWEQGWDSIREESYVVIALSVVRRHD